jgi:hypothetical protein
MPKTKKKTQEKKKKKEKKNEWDVEDTTKLQ